MFDPCQKTISVGDGVPFGNETGTFNVSRETSEISFTNLYSTIYVGYEILIVVPNLKDKQDAYMLRMQQTKDADRTSRTIFP